MKSEIDRFYIPDEPFLEHKGSFWQHSCGLFQWHVSGYNVDLYCASLEIDKISWPNIAGRIMPGS